MIAVSDDSLFEQGLPADVDAYELLTFYARGVAIASIVREDSGECDGGKVDVRTNVLMKETEMI